MEEFSFAGHITERVGLKYELAVRDECISLNSLIDLTIPIDNWIRERAKERQRGQLRTSTHLY